MFRNTIYKRRVLINNIFPDRNSRASGTLKRYFLLTHRQVPQNPTLLPPGSDFGGPQSGTGPPQVPCPQVCSSTGIYRTSVALTPSEVLENDTLLDSCPADAFSSAPAIRPLFDAFASLPCGKGRFLDGSRVRKNGRFLTSPGPPWPVPKT